MTRHQTFRVIVTKSEIFEIDLAARAEVIALTRAERLWDGGMRSRFARVDRQERATFAIDEHATSPLRDIANEDRARWAKKALQAFSQETGSGTGREGFSDLLCDLGHYARSVGLDFDEEFERAAKTCALEVAEEVLS
ncbi:MAG: hypothetical protein K2X41_04440 [Hyphomicrobium sp.]|nr:hypothetical protein [Hyphomicrobium sp.]